MEITITIDAGSSKKLLDQIMRRLGNFQPAFIRMRSIISGIVSRNFAAGGRPGWTPLKESTTRREGPGTPLIRRGKLRAAAESPSVRASATSCVFEAVVGEPGVAHGSGVHGTFNVREHTRKRKGKRPVNVKAHKVNMDLEARPFFIVPSGYGEEERLGGVLLDHIFGR